MKNGLQTIRKYYELHPAAQPSARWTYLNESQLLIKTLNIQPGDRVLEIGCGSGKNFETIQRALQGTGELTAVDSSAPALREASKRVQNKGWKNVLLIDHEYGSEPISPGRSDVVLLSFWLSTVSNWRWALDCAQAELRPGGRIGVVDFCPPDSGLLASASLSHEARLKELFYEIHYQRLTAWFGTMPFYIFVGEREYSLQQEVA